MIQTDIFVGMVAVGLGAFGVGSGIFNWEWSFRLTKMRWLEAKSGRAAARCYYAIIGVGLIVLGVAIAVGFGPNKSTGVRVNTNRRNGIALLHQWLRTPASLC